MKFKEIQFQDAQAKRVYGNYIKDIKYAAKPLSTNDSEDILMEFNSHIYEHLQNEESRNELEAVLDVIDRLGSPEEVLKPLIADKMLEKATKSFNPVHVLRALALNITNGISYVIFALLYLFLGSFVFLIGAKIVQGDKVGMFFKDGEFVVLGMTTGGPGYEEVLGHWFIPTMIVSAVALYFFITLLLKLKKNLLKK